MSKKLIVAIFIAALAMMLVACGGSGSNASSSSSSSNASQSKNVGDSITMHEVYCIDDADTYDEYQIVYFTAGSHTLKSLVDIMQMPKSTGVTQEYLEDFDLDTIYPNFSKFSFASKAVYDDGDYYSVVIRFDDLDVKENLLQLHDNGILELVNRNVDNADADSLMSAMEKGGAQKVSLADYEKLGLTKYR